MLGQSIDRFQHKMKNKRRVKGGGGTIQRQRIYQIERENNDEPSRACARVGSIRSNE